MKLALQILLAIVSLIPLYFGLTGILLGAEGLDPGTAPAAALDNQFRYLSAYYLSFAFLLWYIIPRVTEAVWPLRLVIAAVFIGGLARALSQSQLGPGLPGQTVGMYVELASPLLVIWQALLARRAAP